jgi:hypothetical protein
MKKDDNTVPSFIPYSYQNWSAAYFYENKMIITTETLNCLVHLQTHMKSSFVEQILQLYLQPLFLCLVCPRNLYENKTSSIIQISLFVYI